MALYDNYILPRLIHFTCGLKPAMKQREKVVPIAEGRVLEIGIGSGLNLPIYDASRVSHVWGLDPSRDMWALARERAEDLPFSVEFVEGSAESMPLENNCADTVLVTYTLCTIPNAIDALRDARRVLKPGGKLIFCEHGRAPDANVRKWQNRLNSTWRFIAGGCNLNRDIPAILNRGGFEISELETMYIPGWKPGCFNYWGTAVAGSN